jgi:hypothetical protein
MDSSIIVVTAIYTNMKSINKQIFIFTLLIIILCFLSVLVFNLPPVLKRLDLSNSSQIGDSLGGMTAPVIGIISSVLLYLALTRQIEANSDQKLKNESDIIFSLVNQFQVEIDSFYYKYSQEGQAHIFRGVEGLNKFSNDFPNYSFKSHNFTFEVYFEGKQILLLVRSFQLIEKRLKISPISSDMKTLFSEKLAMLFECVLHNVLSSITTTLEKNEKLIDNASKEIVDFYKSHDKYRS